MRDLRLFAFNPRAGRRDILMDVKFHRIAPLIALACMPDKFRQFMVCDCMSEADISDIATYPDRIDKDNLAQTPEIHHAHSYKLDDTGRWLDGDCVKTIEGTSAFIVDTWKEYRVVSEWPLQWIVRYALAKVTHHRVDALTYPHLHKGKPWSFHHASFEAHMDRWIDRHKDELGPFKFQPYRHVYKDCRETAIDAWQTGKALVEKLEGGGHVNDQDCLVAARSCVNGIGDLWLTLGLQMELC
jgi:hypothetical protein